MSCVPIFDIVERAICCAAQAESAQRTRGHHCAVVDRLTRSAAAAHSFAQLPQYLLAHAVAQLLHYLLLLTLLLTVLVALVTAVLIMIMSCGGACGRGPSALAGVQYKLLLHLQAACGSVEQRTLLIGLRERIVDLEEGSPGVLDIRALLSQAVPRLVRRRGFASVGLAFKNILQRQQVAVRRGGDDDSDPMWQAREICGNSTERCAMMLEILWSSARVHWKFVFRKVRESFC